MTEAKPYRDLKVAVVCCTQASGEIGGAERLYHGLLKALLEAGCDARIVSVPGDESTFEHIIDNYDYCRELDLSGFDLVISTKTPTFAINHPRHVLWLVHTARVFYDMFEENFPGAGRELKEQRALIQKMDTELINGIPVRFTIGSEVSQRMMQYNGVDSSVIHPPLADNPFRQGPTGDYFFVPGRLHPWKRLDLLIEAVKLSQLPLKLKIAGTGEAEDALKALAAGDTRIEFLGRISDEELVSLYADALAVPFVPQREDYGYITIEAFSSGKPVVTCSDSGEPAQLVVDGVNGIVCEPNSRALCTALEHLHQDPKQAARLGAEGKRIVDQMTWQGVVQELLDAGLAIEIPAQEETNSSQQAAVTVLDMQPIDPPVGGGRLRLLGLYHQLGPDFETRYVGSFDWEGEQYRRHMLSKTLEEIDIPLSRAHHVAAAELADKCGGKVVIDLAFPQQLHLSPDYIEEAKSQIERADVVIFSHPWAYPPLAEFLKPGQFLVYDSHNVESFLRAQILDLDNPTELDLIHNIIKTEQQLCRDSDLVLACSTDDLKIFHRIYDLPTEKIKVVPNGVFAQKIVPPTPQERQAARKALGIDETGSFAIFLGSNYGPNIDAAHFIFDELAAILPSVTFVIAGGVGMAIAEGESRANVIVTGFLQESEKLHWLQAVDMAINPMFGGSGTNIKMFDFMASGLPTISTEIGARGIDSPGGGAIQIASHEAQSFAEQIDRIIKDPDHRLQCSESARACVEQGYAWENISPELGRIVRKAQKDRIEGPKKISLVIPSYERPDELNELIACLEQQTFRSFEVIIVDQSAEPWPGADKRHSFSLQYIHTDIKGAVRARNTGAQYASGDIIAFTDDDCRPEPEWLEKGLRYFENDEVVGVEGMIYSDRINEPGYRPVTNVGFEGFGFMTANLMVRHSAFKLSGGFDLTFDLPHFREDTDLGWRLLKLGQVPYGSDVRVFHPAQLRSKIRESDEERAKFFEKDALLYRKHPQRYWSLFHAEGHWSKDNGYWEHFKRGAEKYHVDIEAFSEYQEL
jgi:glycosyltransferase involved in cell wall biosynthesis/GT2 family glycosyltransferase